MKILSGLALFYKIQTHLSIL